MSGRHEHTLRAAVVAADVASGAAAAAAAYLVRFEILDAWVPVPGRTDVLPGRYLAALPAAVLLLVFATAAAGLYDARHARRPPGVADVVRVAVLGAAALACVTLLYWSEFQYSRLTVALAAVFHALLVAALRRAALALANRLVRPGGTLLVGGGAPAAAWAAAVRADRGAPARIVAALPIGGDVPPAARRLATIHDACEAVSRGEASEVVVAVPASHAAEVAAILARLEQTTADVRLVPDIGAAVLVNPGAAMIAGVPVLSLRERPLYGVRAAAKRTLDLALAAAALVVLSPLLAAIALAVRLTSPGPALYRQERMGLDGRPFRMLKFRTMRDGAESETGPVFARRGDPRATPLGRFLRRFSLDELPQLWNVLRGEMSLVGPRPERAPFIEDLRRRIPGYMLRHTVRSGMTGWAQVHGFRGETSFEDRLRYDLEYVDRWSLSLDLVILGRTAVQVLAGRNAY